MKSKRSNSSGPPLSKCRPPAANPDASVHELCLARHQAQCRICRHPQRDAIEQDFLDWVGPRELVQTYNLPSDRAIYRHAHALGLIERRRANRLGALDRIIQRVGEVTLTAGAVVSAIRLGAQLEREAAGPGPSRQGIVLSFTGMPTSDAVRPRHDAEAQSRLRLGELAAPQDGSSQSDPNSRKRLPAAATRTPPCPKPTTNEPSKSLTPHSPAAPGGGPSSPAAKAEQGLPAAARAEPAVAGRVACPERNREAGQLPATQAPSGTDAPRQNAISGELDPPQVAGMGCRWPPEKKFFARRARWRRAGPGP